MWCHLPLALPVLGLVLFLVLPWPVAAPLYGVVVIASVLVYRLLLQALRLPVKTGAVNSGTPRAMNGWTVIVRRDLAVRGTG